MSSQLSWRDLYLPAGAVPDLATAKDLAAALCQTASSSDLCEHDGFIDVGLDIAYLGDADLTDTQLHAMRTAAEHHLGRLLEAFAASLTGPDVSRFPFDRTPDGGHTVDGYVTGGVTPSDAPTEAYEAWDVVFDTYSYPPGWCDQLATALGILHPLGSGPPAATVTFHLWSAPNPPATGRPS